MNDHRDGEYGVARTEVLLSVAVVLAQFNVQRKRQAGANGRKGTYLERVAMLAEDFPEGWNGELVRRLRYADEAGCCIARR